MSDSEAPIVGQDIRVYFAWTDQLPFEKYEHSLEGFKAALVEYSTPDREWIDLPLPAEVQARYIEYSGVKCREVVAWDPIKDLEYHRLEAHARKRIPA